MRIPSLLAAASLCLFACTLSAADPIPPAPRLLPADTLLVLSTPDWSKGRASFDHSAPGQLWADPGMKAFREKFLAKLKKEVVVPLEREFGVDLKNYIDLLQGQATLAYTRNNWDGTPETSPAFVLLVDAGSRSDQLKTNLTELRRKWVANGKQLKSETIRGLEFTTLFFKSDDLPNTFEKIFPDPKAGVESLDAPKPKKESQKLEWTIGQSDSLLILSSAPKEIEKVLILQSGGAVPMLADQAAFASAAPSFRQALGFAWADSKAVLDTISRQNAAQKKSAPAQPLAAPSIDKILNALGIGAVRSTSFAVEDQPAGTFMNFALHLPEANRQGFMRILSLERKDASPPAFIPADAVKFSRARLDLAKTWTTIETMLTEISPQLGGGLKLMLDTAGKDKDPNFDFRRSFVGNLGDDLILFSKAPRDATVAAQENPPSLTLLGARNADQMALALKNLGGLLPPQITRFKEREFLGRKIYSLNLPFQTGAAAGAKPAERSLNFAASGGYVAFSSDTALLEQFLRSGEGQGKSLRDTPGLNEAAQKVGGMNTGFFSYENQNEQMRSQWETWKKDSASVAVQFGASNLGGRLGMAEDSSDFKEWFDLSLLPPFERVSRYFTRTVSAWNVDSQALSLKTFTPAPASR